MAAAESDRDKTEKRTNVLAAVGIGFVCVVVGLPLWWKTTEVYRVSLPYSDIEHLAKIKIEYTVDVNVVSFVEKMSAEDLATLSKHLMDKLDDNSSVMVKSKYRTTVREAAREEIDLLKTSASLIDLDSRMSSHLPGEANKYFVIILPTGSSLSVPKPTLGLHRCVFITYTNQDMASFSTSIVKTVKHNLIREGTVMKGFNTARGARNMKPDKETLRAVRSNPGYDLTLTLVSPRPDIIDVQWDIEQAVNAYLKPLVLVMEDYAIINVKSQVLFFTRLHTRPHQDKTKQEFYFTSKELPHIINPLEAKLRSAASTNPDLNLLVYVPSRKQYPLYIRDDNGNPVESNSFLSPQWGGIQIYNIAPPLENDTLPIQPSLDMRKVMQVFMSQLRLLLNLHSQVAGDVTHLPVGNIAELDSWLRSRCVENLATSSATLKSLAQLLEKISNIVINDDIGKEVQQAVDAMKTSHQLLLEGHLVKAFLHSTSAIIASEKAFFDPSLLELLYFPEDQKFAIYIPLFLPISFPVLASLYQSYKWIKGGTKPKQD